VASQGIRPRITIAATDPIVFIRKAIRSIKNSSYFDRLVHVDLRRCNPDKSSTVTNIRIARHRNLRGMGPRGIQHQFIGGRRSNEQRHPFHSD
jgi:hypothetical protein